MRTRPEYGDDGYRAESCAVCDQRIGYARFVARIVWNPKGGKIGDWELFHDPKCDGKAGV